MIRILTGLQYGGVIAALLFGSGIDYPPAPDGISWWNLWLAFVSLGVTATATFILKAVKRKRYIRRKFDRVHMAEEVGRGRF